MVQRDRARIWKYLACIPLLILLSGPPAAAQTIPKAGEAVIPFSLTDISGRLHSPDQYKGKVLVLWFVGHN